MCPFIPQKGLTFLFAVLAKSKYLYRQFTSKCLTIIEISLFALAWYLSNKLFALLSILPSRSSNLLDFSTRYIFLETSITPLKFCVAYFFMVQCIQTQNTTFLLFPYVINWWYVTVKCSKLLLVKRKIIYAFLNVIHWLMFWLLFIYCSLYHWEK